MIAFQTFAHLATIDLGAPAPKPTSIAGNQMEAAVTLWTSPDGLAEAGVWECTPGRFTANRETNSEICHIVKGRVTLHDEDGRSRDVAPGEMLVLPIGWKGEWTIHETTRKLYIIKFEKKA
ncbi:MAG: hypothetical protein RJA94_264 [Pseudomonadota bacterium]|jgi:uncharacterized cupin superfamily protein